METQKKLVLVTGLFAVLFLGGSVAYKVMQPPIPIVLNTQGQPAIGSGKVQIVVFEDFSGLYRFAISCHCPGYFGLKSASQS